MTREFVRAIGRETLRNPIRIVGVALAVALAWSALTPDARAGAGQALEIEPFVAYIHADWCRTCRMLAPTWLAIESEFGERAHLVKLDVSDRAAVERSTAEAERLGLSEFFREHRAATGTIGVIDGRTRQPIAVMRGENDLSKYREAIAKTRPQAEIR
jgi:thiol-disulfide isomerase/thioredoxin